MASKQNPAILYGIPIPQFMLSQQEKDYDRRMKEMSRLLHQEAFTNNLLNKEKSYN